MLEPLKNRVYNANRELAALFGCRFSWISVSAVDREAGLAVIMPEGGALEPEDMALVDWKGSLVEGKEPPVCDTAVHLALYREFPEIGAIAHPYARWATVFAQRDMGIPTLGAVHSGTFAADIPIARLPAEAGPWGSAAIGAAIAACFHENGIRPLDVPAVLVSRQGAYTFGADALQAVGNAEILEETAFLAYHTMQPIPSVRPLGPL